MLETIRPHFRMHAAAMFLMLAGNLLWAQESSNASGGNALGPGGTVTYSVGQPFFLTDMATQGSVAQGVQHAYEIYSVGIDEESIGFGFSVFPNPAVDILTLKVKNWSGEPLQCILFNADGKTLRAIQVNANEIHFLMEDLPAAAYFLSVLNEENKTIKSFKIIKTL